jgi:Family of unknown function (DUF6093)
VTVSAATALARGRAAVEALMVDACEIRRRGAGGSVDDDTGVITPDRSTLYTGKCRVQQQSMGGAARAQTPGEDYQLLLGLEVQLPVVGSEGLQVGDEIEITAAAHDTDLVGQVFLIRDLFAKTHATSRRVGVTRRTS